MSTLLLRLAAPLQSWGRDSKFERRITGRTPTKSGVIGICAAALGLKRWEDEKIKNLISLRFGVRIDKAGVLLRDFHMAHEESFWDIDNRSKINRGKKSSSYLTNRYYITDAIFLAGLEGNEDLLSEIDHALHYPAFPLYLGRRSCPPEGRLSLGIVSDNLQLALEKYPPLFISQKTASAMVDGLRVIMDANNANSSNDSYLVHDQPLSFNPVHRKHDYRSIYEFKMPILTNERNHDALAAVEEADPCS